MQSDLPAVTLREHPVATAPTLAVSVRAAIAVAEASMGVKRKEKDFKLRKEQKESVFKLATGKDVFVCLPTGYGKSMCYIILPCVFDLLYYMKKSIVLVVSPLSALMKDQVATITAMGISAVYITDKQSATPLTRQAIQNGEIQIILISPEALFCGTEWRGLLCTDVYRKNLMAFVVDEAHCIKDWYVCYS